MAANNSNPVYLYDLPYRAMKPLCDILDVDRRWRDLAGTFMGYDITTIQLIEQSVLRDKSPTMELLDRWSKGNRTINGLFVMLAKMDHQRAMLILKPYVDEKYHQYIRQNDSAMFRSSDLPRPSSYMNSKSSFSSQSSCLYDKSSFSKCASGYSKYNESSSSIKSKFQNDMNINENLSSVSMKSKTNVLGVSNNLSKNGNPNEKRSPDFREKKKNSYDNFKAESMIDNCASEKIKNVRKSSLPQELLLNGRQLVQPSYLACASNLSSFEEALPDVMQISYHDICKATDNFSKSRILGKGGFGTVYEGKWKGTSVAIKRLTPREGHDSASQQLVSLKQSINELSILKCCRFDHILPLYGVSLDGVDPCLVYQLMVNGSLEDWLVCRKKTPPLTWSQRSHIAECTTKGLNYLHTTPGKPLVHGDIKCANILLDSNMDAKIGDFGLTREGPGCDHTHVKVSSLHGTACYLPPEYLRERHLSPQVDIYSYGIVLLEMATGLRPYDQKRGDAKLLVDYVSDCSTSGRLDSLRDVKAGEENMTWFRELLQIGQKCSSKEKKKRPPMLEVLEQFDKIKEEMSIVGKIRRVSNDKGTVIDIRKLSEDSDMRKLSPIQLQRVYDNLRIDGQGSVHENEPLEDSQPQNNDLNITPTNAVWKDENVPVESVNSFEIRGSQSSNLDNINSSELSLQNDSLGAIAARFLDANANGSDVRQDSSTVVTPPLPELTLLQLKISEFNDFSETVSDNGYAVSNASSDFISESEQ